ncbi:MAG: ribosome recycling factor [Chloroflexi bacterium]|nr:ribosome recycling factor [Chloroflexota bacterium]
MSDDVLLDAEDRMEKAVEAFRNNLATVRTGRASTALIEHLPVAHYGQSMALNQLATLAAPEPHLLTVQPWDQGTMNSIMKAIQTSDLGINPSNDGRLIRLPVPPLTEQRRRELARQVHARAEEARVAVRNVRRHAVEELRKELRAGDLPEDEERHQLESVEKLTHQFGERIDELTKGKERELLEV